MDKSPGRSYEDERLGPRSSEILNRYSEERRSRSKERLVRDGRPKKKKSNLVDPYLTRVISEEKPRSPENKESSMERYHQEESFRRNLNVNDLERRRADDAYINNVRERVIIEQSKKLALREEHGQFDIRTKR